MRISDWSSDVCSSDLRVNYMAKVRITVGGVLREGCGFGQGIDKDVGQAHESAIKESETDAMKRALMTFGNQFGLALYDKTRANVCAPDPEPVTDEQLMRLQDTADDVGARSEEHTSELQSLMRISYAVFCLKK